MSRIAGIAFARAPALQADGLAAMITRLCKGTTLHSCTKRAGHVSLGWCGSAYPNISQEHDILAVVDGSFFNRDELGIAGRDAELLISLYRQYGFAGALKKINGDFSLALYDKGIDTLWLARDRIGVKPLYYAADPRFFSFASQPGALLTLPGMDKGVDSRFIAFFAGSHYRYFDNNPDRSPYTGINQLPAAHMLCFSGNRIEKTKYWSLFEAPELTGSEEVLAGNYQELLLDSVLQRFKTARRPVFTLSGGMDSSSVLASAVYLSGNKQHALSATYSDKTFDESAEICGMLDSAVEKWNVVEIGTPDVFGLIRRMISVHDEPVATATWLSHYLLCEKAAQLGYDSLFGGLGGDELNAGEYEYFLCHFADLRQAGKEELLADEVKMWMHYHDHPLYKKNTDVVQKSFDELFDLNIPGKCLPNRSRLERYRAALSKDYYGIVDDRAIVMEHPFSSCLKNRTWQDLSRETTPCCLRAEDRQTNAFGLDYFLPFLDYRLIEFMFRVPGTLKIWKGITKRLLREAMRGILPEDTRTRVKKIGWNAPAHIWFGTGCRDELLDMIHSQEFRTRGIYNVDVVDRLVEEHHEIVASGRSVESHMMFLWQMVNLELWLRGLGS
jgi:asparagine synthase (glutamine-hydrolysing)